MATNKSGAMNKYLNFCRSVVKPALRDDELLLVVATEIMRLVHEIDESPMTEAAMAIETFSVKSSNIAWIAYDKDTRTGTLEFRSGVVYTIESVDRSVIEEMASSPSPTAYYNRHVKNTYAVRIRRSP